MPTWRGGETFQQELTMLLEGCALYRACARSIFLAVL